ncbi:hypothetical protein [Rhodobacter capsulatus]|uniref:hypothetical protein n=1 Tax=Rhodobacter capsulatus TaxID=1061 RepID=UPI00146AD15D|nr:hypothetical protein [Rhodobacter capsulatus]
MDTRITRSCLRDKQFPNRALPLAARTDLRAKRPKPGLPLTGMQFHAVEIVMKRRKHRPDDGPGKNRDKRKGPSAASCQSDTQGQADQERPPAAGVEKR